MARHRRYDRAARLSRRTASAAFDSSAQFQTEAAAEAVIDMLWEYYRVKATRNGTTVRYEEPRDPEQLDDMLELINDIIEQDELYIDQFGPASPGDAEALGWDEDEEFDDSEGEEWKSVAMEPEVEEPPEDYKPRIVLPVGRNKWRPRGPWVDLVIDYSQLPSEDQLLKYAHREMGGLEVEQLVDILENYEGRDDREGEQDFVAALLLLTAMSPEADSWWDYLRAYRYAQENKGAGLSRLMRRVKHRGVSAEAARRSNRR